MMRTQAADAIDVGRKCSLTVSVEGDFDDSFEADLNEMKIPVSLYRVASVDEVGRYTGVGSCQDMAFDTISSTTTAEDWMAFAEEAEEKLGETDPLVTEEMERGQGTTASAVFTDLETGMYLVVPQATYNQDYSYEYTFTPYLTALPGNTYATTGAGDDSWIYDPAIGLKAERVQMDGVLNIRKTLETYNETHGAVTCVFQVDGYDENGEVIYSNVISATLAGAGEENAQTVRLEGIPAGIRVTVREVYKGAGYSVVGSDTADAVIVSEEANANGAEEALVSFVNEYNGGNRGGYGVTNHFESDGNDGWNWTTDVQSEE